MTKDENEMLAVKYSCKPLGSLPDVELLKITKVLLIKIHVLTGWTVPEKEFSDILTDQLFKKIKESYSTVNQDEFEYAFRQNTTVQDWGKNMNISLIDTVMADYLEKRFDISRIEEMYKERPLLPAPKNEDKLSNEDFIKANKSVFNLTKNYGLIHPRCYDMLIKEKKIILTNEQKEVIKTKARALFFDIDNLQYAKGLCYEEQERFIKLDCKKIAVAEYFNQQP